MNAVHAEFLKLRRSLSWAVVLLLPAVLAVAGSVMTLIDGRPLDDGWHTLWLRSVVFYGLFPLAVGIAALASLVWRSEHRGGNWNALMGGPVSSLRIVLGKAAAVALPAAAMQLVMLAAVLALGKLAYGLPGMLPAQYFLVSVLIMLAAGPASVLQSWLSMRIRSFAVPVGIAFMGAGLSAALLLAEVPGISIVSPYALLSRVTQLGTGEFADGGVLTPATALSVVATSVLVTAVLTALSARALDRSDTRT
jgi:hypothetical protein